MFDYGTFFGGIFIGYVGDRIKMRGIILVPCLVIATLLMAVVKYMLGSYALGYYFCILGIGMF